MIYANLLTLGIPALVSFGWVYPSDVDRFTIWIRESKVPGAFLDLQRRTSASAFTAIVEDLRAMRHRFPDGFLWLINGVQKPERMHVLREVLGSVRFTSAGPWQQARNRRTFAADTLQVVHTELSVEDAFFSSVLAMTAAAETSRSPLRAAERASLLGFRVPEVPDAQHRRVASRT